MAGNKGLKFVNRLPEVNKLSKLVVKVLGRELRRILSREGEGGSSEVSSFQRLKCGTWGGERCLLSSGVSS